MGEPLHFSKLEALGNDFVLLDCRDGSPDPDRDRIRALADRHTGIGFDQLLCLHPTTLSDCDWAVNIYNCDGSAASQCGNGMRAIGLWLNAKDHQARHFRLETAAGPISLEVVSADQIRVAMGEPRFGPAAIGLGDTLETLGAEQLLPDLIELGAVSMGNPHLVVMLNHAADARLVGELGRTLGTHPALADGANVSFAHFDDSRQLDLRVFERGVGPTRACGSAACASAAWLLHSGQASGAVHVNQPGGTLVIDWRGSGNPLFMTGPARHVFDGTYGILI